jgi:hypothetical protein
MKSRCSLGFVVALALCFSSVPAGTTALGSKISVVFSNAANFPTQWVNPSFKTGFTGGMFLNYAVNNNFSLQPELLYTQKGATTTLYNGLVAIDATASFDYFELPLLAMYTFSTNGNLKPYVYGGPGFAYNLSSSLDVSLSIFSASIDLSSITHTTDFIILTGGGVDHQRRRFQELRIDFHGGLRFLAATRTEPAVIDVHTSPGSALRAPGVCTLRCP